MIGIPSTLRGYSSVMARRQSEEWQGIIPAHALGARVDEITHLCPDCGWHTKAFCPTCLGVGQVTEERLAWWQRNENAKMSG